MYVKLKNLYARLNKNEVLYAIMENMSIYHLEPEENFLAFKLFLNKDHAEAYKMDLVENDVYRPSSVKVVPILLPEVFELIDELEVVAQSCYNLPVEIQVIEFDKDMVVLDSLYNSNVELN